MLNLKFKSVKIRGFLSIADAEYDVQPGATVIRGVNSYDSHKVSNGSGKSSLVEAIVWALTGQTARGLKDKRVANTRMGSCEVRLELLVNDVEHVIVRGIDGTKNRLQVFDADGKDLGIGYAKSKSILADIIGVDPEFFLPLIFFMERMPNRFSALAPKDRKAMIEEMANSDLVGKLDEGAKAVVNEIGTQVSQVAANLHQLNGKVQVIQAQISAVRSTGIVPSRTEVVTQIERYNQEVQGLSQAAQQAQQMSEQSRTLYATRQQLTSQWTSLVGQINGIDAEVQKLTTEHQHLSVGACPYCQQVWPGSAQKMGEIVAKVNELHQARPAYYQQFEQVQAQVGQVDSQIAQVDGQIAQLNQSVARLGEIQRTISALQGQLASLDTVDAREGELRTLMMDLMAIQGEHEALTKQATTYQTLAKVISKDLRNIAIAAYLEALQTILTYYSEFLGMDVRLDIGKTSVDILYEDRVYEQLSNGESRAVDIILQTAFRDLMQIRSNLVVYDEIFDGLDAVASDSVVELIQSMLGEDDAMFVITHAAHVSILGATIMTVEKRPDGFSYLEQDAPIQTTAIEV